eukprot:765097-Hanusia_phi.AAC.2
MSCEHEFQHLLTDFWAMGDLLYTGAHKEAFKGDCLWVAYHTGRSAPMFFVRCVVNGTTTVRHQRLRAVSRVDTDHSSFKIIFSVQGLNGTVECPLYFRITGKTKRSQFDNIVKVAEAAHDLIAFPRLFVRCDGTVPSVVVEQSSGPPSKGIQNKLSQDELSRIDRMGSKRAGALVKTSLTQKSEHIDKLKDIYLPTSPQFAKDNRSTPVKEQTKMTNFYGRSTQLSGFRNIGNSCYMAAITSVLINLQTFVDDIESISANLRGGLKTEDYIGMHSKNHGVLDLKPLKEAIGKRSKQFAGQEQQDAHEFYTNCLDAISVELKKLQKNLRSKDLTRKLLPICDAVDDNMSFEVVHKFQCKNTDCKYNRIKKESFREISLPIPDIEMDQENKLQMQELVAAFFSNNVLEYKCEKCGHTETLAAHRFLKLPRILVVHLKRFKVNWLEGEYEKSSIPIEIPRSLNVRDFCFNGTLRPKECVSKAKIPTAKPIILEQGSSSLATPGAKTSYIASHVGHNEERLSDSQQENTLSSLPTKIHDNKRANNSFHLNDTDVLCLDSVQDRCSPGHLCIRVSSSILKICAGIQRKLDFEEVEKGGLVSDANLHEKSLHGGRRTRENLSDGRSSKRSKLEDADKGEERMAEDEELSQAIKASMAEYMAKEESNSSNFDRTKFSVGTEEDDLRIALQLSEQADEASEGVALTSDDSSVEDTADEGAECENEDVDFETSCKSTDSEFRLHAIVSHCGQSASSGHYVSDIYDSKQKQWNRYDDAVVSCMGDALHAQRSDWTTGGYLLVYMHNSCYAGEDQLSKKSSRSCNAFEVVLHGEFVTQSLWLTPSWRVSGSEPSSDTSLFTGQRAMAPSPQVTRVSSQDREPSATEKLLVKSRVQVAKSDHGRGDLGSTALGHSMQDSG